MNKLKQARKDRKKTLQYVADALGVSRQRYFQIEQNPDRARIEQAKTIGKALGKDPSTIFFD